MLSKTNRGCNIAKKKVYGLKKVELDHTTLCVFFIRTKKKKSQQLQ